jgi:hypothetical protein
MDTSLVEEGGVDGDLPEDVLRHGVWFAIHTWFPLAIDHAKNLIHTDDDSKMSMQIIIFHSQEISHIFSLNNMVATPSDPYYLSLVWMYVELKFMYIHLY